MKAGLVDVRARSEKGAAEADDGRARPPRVGVEEAQALAGRGPLHHEPLHGVALRPGSREAPNGFRLPFNLETGEVDPRALEEVAPATTRVNLVAEVPQEPRVAAQDLHRLRLARPVHIHYGTRILSKRLHEAGIAHACRGIDDNHPTSITVHGRVAAVSLLRRSLAIVGA